MLKQKTNLIVLTTFDNLYRNFEIECAKLICKTVLKAFGKKKI